MKFPSLITFDKIHDRNTIYDYVLPETITDMEWLEAAGLIPQCGCDGNAASDHGPALDKGWIYAFGDIRPVLPSQSVEKEFYQVAVTDPFDKTKPFTNALAYKYLSRTENLYIAREMNWVFSIRGQFDLYIIKVTTNRALSVLIETIAPYSGAVSYDILIASKEGYSKRESTSGTNLPVIDATQIYTITNTEYIAAIVKATGASQQAAAKIFSDSLSLTNTKGDEDKFRALNFIVLRYMAFYKKVYELGNEKYLLTSVRAGSLEIFGKSKILEIIFSFQSSETSASQAWACTVDVSNEFPFISAPLARYYHGI